MKRTTGWNIPCPVCGGKTHFDRMTEEGELMYVCKSAECAHSFSMIMTDEALNERVKSLYCNCCGSPLKTNTHKIYTPSIIRKFLQCSNASCSQKYPLLVTFGRTLSPSALGEFNPDSGNTTLYATANHTNT